MPKKKGLGGNRREETKVEEGKGDVARESTDHEGDLSPI